MHLTGLRAAAWTGMITAALALAGAAWPQTADSTPVSDAQLADRLAQLVESTAVIVPGLAKASEGLRQLAGGTLASMRAAPQDAALRYRFGKQVGIYVALADSFPRPEPFPAVAERQFTDLHEGLQRYDTRFGAWLEDQRRAAEARDADPSGSARYAEADSKLLPAGSSPRVVFLGDSITDSWRLNEYFTGRDFVNRGISGQTTLQMLGRFMQDVMDLKPKAVLILAGTNDIARGVKPPSIEQNLALMGDLAKAYGIAAVFASILPVSDYHKGEDARFEMTRTRPPAVIRQINTWLQDYCRREGFTYLDYYSAMADPSGQMTADMADDGLHPNAKGYRVMAPLALDALNRALRTQGSPSPQAQRSRK
ncbi:MAG TPA: GDSL-type esterase/lipase family protein [Bryobacteraceae bacterium]|nr:GDSL-type esterase/lipase family protein [Bryobacteraceae bacterium]